jgi:DNA-binding transcriptional MerR regulator
MRATGKSLSPTEAARRLNISVKALRLYEQRGLIAPGRTAAGWRSYAPADMARAREIADFRAIGLSLAQIARVLVGDATDLEPALASHQAVLEHEATALAARIDRVRRLRAEIGQGETPGAKDLGALLRPAPAIGFALPWPWGGEAFELRDIAALTYIVGPLGGGKTRLAMRLAESLAGAVFVPLDRGDDGGAAARATIAGDPEVAQRVDRALARLVEDGATVCDALVALLAALEAPGPAAFIVDMIEQGLDHASQEALIAHLRYRRGDRRPLFMLTRSSAILDPAAIGPDEAIILCPANHSPPSLVTPIPGAAGYEAVATCLGSPETRARTAGTIAWRSHAA